MLEATFRRHLLSRARLHLDEPTLIWARALPPFYNTNVATFLIGRPGDRHLEDPTKAGAEPEP